MKLYIYHLFWPIHSSTLPIIHFQEGWVQANLSPYVSTLLISNYTCHDQKLYRREINFNKHKVMDN